MQPYGNFQSAMPVQMQYAPMYGQQMQSPYQERLANLQSFQQSLQTPPQVQSPQFVGLNGRIVDSPESIMASEVPMDGTFAIFPKRDMSEVYVKYWTGDGKIATIGFKPITDLHTDTLSPNQQNVKFDEISSVLGGIYEKVDTLSSKVDEMLKTKASPRSKKEVNADE